MKRSAALVLSCLLTLPQTVHAAPQVERVRGTITAVEPGAISVRTIDGRTETIVLTPRTGYASLVRSSLGAITDGAFIGTATKGDDPPTALEVHIFPESMRGTGEGHRAWDAIPDTSAGGTRVESAMTNGTVRSGSPGGAPRVESAMTNGTVARSTGTGDTTTLVVTYGGGQSLAIRVPPQAPIVAYEPADRSIVQTGGKVFLTAERDGDRLTAVRVSVGKDGLTPPQ